jgi:hypothetical protein
MMITERQRGVFVPEGAAVTQGTEFAGIGLGRNRLSQPKGRERQLRT